MLQWGKPEYLRLFEKRAREGKATPALQSRPELFPELIPFWQAFSELHKRRQVGFGPSPIPLTEIECWLRLNNYTDPDDIEDFLHLIGVMDETWLVWARSQRKQPKDRKNANPSSSD